MVASRKEPSLALPGGRGDGKVVGAVSPRPGASRVLSSVCAVIIGVKRVDPLTANECDVRAFVMYKVSSTGCTPVAVRFVVGPWLRRPVKT